MAEQAKAAEQDQSMEEILQSIKRIIAEEGDATPPLSPPVAKQSAPAPAPTPAAFEPPAPAPFGSDVLELTDMIEEKPIDPIDAIMALTPPTPLAAAPVAPAEEPEAAMPALQAEDAPDEDAFSPSPITPADVEFDTDELLSAATIEASASSLRTLIQSSPAPAPATGTGSGAQFRSGLTVEDLVIESLKPMLREWLEENLQQIVERKVQREIERISRQGL